MKPFLLDLCCKAGGATRGYQQAGFYVIGVDIEPQPNYCGDEFYQSDIFAPLIRELLAARPIEAIHVSPPCQKWTVGAKANGNHHHPDLIAPIRGALLEMRVPWVIENVPGAPLRPDLMLCGSMFGLQVQRHRIFESSVYLRGSKCHHVWNEGRPFTVTGHADGPKGYRRKKYLGFIDLAHAKALMGMPWAGTTREVTEAIPPAYTRFIGERLMEYLARPLVTPASQNGSEA